MAAEVSSLFRVLNEYSKDDHNHTVGNEAAGGKSSGLITRDLLGAGAAESQELDLDLQVPSGWEKRLDLKSGKVYLQRCNSSNSPSSSSDYNKQHQSNQAISKLQDLNFPPSSSKVTLNLFDESSLDLKLVSSSPSASASTASNIYQSVCTLDKVKCALERAEKEPIRKRSSLWKSSLSPSYSSSSSSVKEIQEDEVQFVPAPMAVGCPGCLSYVLIMKNNPKCPRCNTVVAVPSVKKPRIDLNMSI